VRRDDQSLLTDAAAAPAEIERSREFYRRLGFAMIDTGRCQLVDWACMHCSAIFLF